MWLCLSAGVGTTLQLPIPNVAIPEIHTAKSSCLSACKKCLYTSLRMHFALEQMLSMWVVQETSVRPRHLKVVVDSIGDPYRDGRGQVSILLFPWHQWRSQDTEVARVQLGGYRRQCIETRSVDHSAKRGEKFFAFIFQLPGWALVAPSCFALQAICNVVLLCRYVIVM